MDSTTEIIKVIYIAILPGIIMGFLIAGIFYFQKEKIYRYPSEGWIDVKKTFSRLC